MKKTIYTCEYCSKEVPEIQGGLKDPLTNISVTFVEKFSSDQRPAEKILFIQNDVCQNCIRLIKEKLTSFVEEHLRGAQ